MQNKTFYFFILTMLSFFYISAAKAHYPIQPSYYFPVKINNKSNYAMKLEPCIDYQYAIKCRGGTIEFLANIALNVYDSVSVSYSPHALVNPNEDAVIGWFKVNYIDQDNFPSNFVANIKFKIDLPKKSSNYVPPIKSEIDIIAEMTFDKIDGFSLKIKGATITKDYDYSMPKYDDLEFMHQQDGDVVINITDSDISKISLCQSPILMEY